MKRPFLLKFSIAFTLVLFLTKGFGQSKSDTLAIQNILQEEEVSWNNGNAETYSKHFAADGTFTNILGTFFTGHKEFMIRHDQIFKGVFAGTVLIQNITSLRFITSDAAIVETLTWVSGFSKDGPPKGANLDEKGRLRTRLLQVVVRNKDKWEIVAYHNVDVKSGIPTPEPN